MKYPHLHLTEWPFRIVPDKSFYRFMADRSQLVADVSSLLRNLSRRASSSMHLMWAWFGAGKTHTLRHIQYLCKTKFSDMIPVYIEFPKSAKNFIDVYRVFISAIDFEIVNDAYLEVFTSPEKDGIQDELDFDFPDLSNALMLLYQGDRTQRGTAMRWLRTETREKAVLKSINITNPIQSSEDAIKVISWLIHLINSAGAISGHSKRMLWMIDEYQRIEKLRRPVIDEINGCLHAIFNRSANGLSILVSFSGYPEEKKLPLWLSPEIKDRIGIEKPLLLPPLSKSEAFELIRGTLANFRRSSSEMPNEYFPFSKKAIYKVVEIIESRARKSKRKDEPKPRTIMQFFNAVLEEADILIENNEIKIIDENFASKVLEDISLPEME